jgi:hypothetical protein
MATKISIFKTTADGEQVNVEIELTQEHLKQMEPTVRKYSPGPGKPVETEIVPGKSLRDLFGPCFQLVDDRLLEMNNRIMASNVLVKKLSPEGRYAVTNIMEVLTGRSRGPAPEEILRAEKAEREAAQAALETAKTDVPE